MTAGPVCRPGASAGLAAVIDAGSNSVRMEIAEFAADGGVRVLERVSKSVRLGHDTFRLGHLTVESIAATVSAFRDFRRMLDSYGVGTIRAVATSAVREASNSDALLSRVMMTTGIEIELIDPLEEGRLIVQALLEKVGGSGGGSLKSALVMEVGGGGTLITCLAGGQVQWSKTLDIGSVRLPQSLGITDLPAEKAAAILSRQVRTGLASFDPPYLPPRPFMLVALGGDARLAARRLGGAKQGVLSAVGLSQLREMVAGCSGLELPALMKKYGLSLSEAETLVPALVMIQSVASRLRLRTVHVSDVTMRDGLLLDLASAGGGGAPSLMATGTVQAARLLAGRYHTSLAHAENVAATALALFEEMRPEHGYGPRERLQLHAAALLHESGRFVDSRSHHKHSFYLISNSEVFGLSREELLNVAHIARYHRRSAPRTSHLDFMALSRERRMLISRLAALLRVADCLDRQKLPAPRELGFRRTGDTLYVLVGEGDDLSLEQRALSSVGDLFEDIYGMRVRFASSSAVLPPAEAEDRSRELRAEHLTRQASLEMLPGGQGTGGPHRDMLLNRELSWLDFDSRVLAEAENPAVPLLDRLKFLAISAGNMDEFFMIRVAGLMRRVDAGITSTDASGLAPGVLLEEILRRTGEMSARQVALTAELLEELAGRGVRVVSRAGWTPVQKAALERHFAEEIMPLLTPMTIGAGGSAPLLQGLRLHAAFMMPGAGVSIPSLLVIPLPAQTPRFVRIPGSPGDVAMLEDLLIEFRALAAPGREPLSSALFRVTRDADVSVDDDDVTDLLIEIERAVLSRRHREPVRLEMSEGVPHAMSDAVCAAAGVERPGIPRLQSRMVDIGGLMELVSTDAPPGLREEPWPPRRPVGLPKGTPPSEAMDSGEILLIHPYESFDPVLELLEWASSDPSVLAVKQTLYRTSTDSPVTTLLERAARNGKAVTVLVELKARFDEERNAGWARRLEDSGCQVIYGVAGLKTHAKALLVVSREGGSIRRRAHLSTGNYNERTALLYSDIGLMTSDETVCTDVASFFNILTGQSDPVGFESTSVAPLEMKGRILELVEREAAMVSAGRPGRITAKLNSLEDPEMIDALYRASSAGVKVMLNVRGICCLRPGVPGVSENVEVVSVVDRFLEHARIVRFGGGGAEEIYLSSADWMTRNLDRRVELLFPVKEPRNVLRLGRMLDAFFEDRAKGWRLGADGTWVRAGGDPATRAQALLYRTGVFREDS